MEQDKIALLMGITLWGNPLRAKQALFKKDARRALTNVIERALGRSALSITLGLPMSLATARDLGSKGCLRHINREITERSASYLESPVFPLIHVIPVLVTVSRDNRALPNAMLTCSRSTLNALLAESDQEWSDYSNGNMVSTSILGIDFLEGALEMDPQVAVGEIAARSIHELSSLRNDEGDLPIARVVGLDAELSWPDAERETIACWWIQEDRSRLDVAREICGRINKSSREQARWMKGAADPRESIFGRMQ